MKYLEVTFTTHPCNETVNDVVSALAGEIGFESFVECEGGIQAYIQQTLFDEEALKEMVANFPLPDTRIEYTIKEAEDKNWNEEWEKNFFQPIVIGDRCCIHSTFHKDTPKTEYEILINPQMAFGTGHHETTSSIISELLEADLKGKSVLDMGCGTSILAILASMRGANPVTAIDIDPYKTECIKGNNCKTPMEKRNKVLMVSKTMSQKRAEDLERITSEYGTMLRMNRSIQAEGSFADVKEDMNFRRYLYRGKANALAESILLAMGRNINKLHCKIQTGRTGSHLFSLKTA